MILRMRFFRKFVVENVRNGAVEADGKPARVKRNGISLAGCPKTSDGARDNLREARKRQTERETICGKPENENLRERCSREGREKETRRMTLAGSPQKGFLTFDARGSPARGKI